jgi:hypothetical protein
MRVGGTACAAKMGKQFAFNRCIACYRVRNHLGEDSTITWPSKKHQKGNARSARRTPAFDARNAVDETRAKPLCIYRFDQGHSRGVSAKTSFLR